MASRRCKHRLPVIIERQENVIALRPSGSGKTHVALGLGLAAPFSVNANSHREGNGQKGMPVSFVTAASLVHKLMEARDEKRLLRLQRQLAKVKLLIIGVCQRSCPPWRLFGVTKRIALCRCSIALSWIASQSMRGVLYPLAKNFTQACASTFVAKPLTSQSGRYLQVRNSASENELSLLTRGRL